MAYIGISSSTPVEGEQEKLSQAFMQIVWMENDLRKPNSNILSKFGWSNQELWFFQSFDLYLVCPLSGGTLLQPVMSQQNNCLMGLYIQISQYFTFHENLSSLYLYTVYLGMLIRAKMIVCAFLIDLDQPDYWYPRKINKICENLYMYKVNWELISCGITDSDRVPSREGDIHNFA